MKTRLTIACLLASCGVTHVVSGDPCPLGPSDLFCEEFEYGDASGNVNNAPFWNLWPIDSDPGSCEFSSWNEIVWIDDETYHDHVYYGLYSCMGKQEKLETIGSGHNKRNLSPLVANRTPGATAVQGTTANPLVLSFALDLNSEGKQWELTRYVELTKGNEEAPTDHYDVVCFEKNKVWPQFPERVPFPGNGVKAAIAVGAVAYLDEDPCFPENYQRPNAYQLAIFDGLAWYRLKGNLFGPDELDLEKRWNFVRLTLTETNIHVWLRNKERQCQPWCQACCDGSGGTIPDCGGCWVEYEANVPRQYLGPFDGVAIGNGGCLDAQWPSWVDSLSLGGGLDVSPDNGACCWPDGTCVVTSESDCRTQGGSFDGTPTCGGTACCPAPFADGDEDHDVDQDDFGAWQICFTGSGGGVPEGCGCFDRDSDNDIDPDDFEAFARCWTGPNVPWTQASTPTCAP